MILPKVVLRLCLKVLIHSLFLGLKGALSLERLFYCLVISRP